MRRTLRLSIVSVKLLAFLMSIMFAMGIVLAAACPAYAEGEMQTQDASERNYAVYANGTLTFKYGPLEAGANVYTGFDTAPASGSPRPLPPWNEVSDSITKVVFDSTCNEHLAPISTEGWFYGHTKLTQIEGLSYLNTSNVTNMRYMFFGCSSLSALNVASFDTSQVTDMSHMFHDCSALSTLDVSYFNTSQVTNMSYMFDHCGAAVLNLSNFDTANVTDMSYMFHYFDDNTSSRLEGIAIDNSFSTAHVTNMNSMFDGCVKLTEVDVSSFDTSNVTDMGSMFRNCKLLTTLDLSHFNTSNVWLMSSMFDGCEKLATLTLGSNFGSKKLEQMNLMFSGCKSLTSLSFPDGFTTWQTTKFHGVFSNCEKLSSLDLSKYAPQRVDDAAEMFSGCTNLTSIDLSNFNTTSAADMKYMFSGCSELNSIKLGSGFKFKGANIKQEYDDYGRLKKGWAILPTPLTADPYAGTWWKDGSFATQCTPAEIQSKTGSGVAGTWTWAQPKYYAQYSNGILTFKGSESIPSGAWNVRSTGTSQPWSGNKTSITKVKFDSTFARALPTSTASWFNGCSSLATFEGMQYLHTSSVTNMSNMFNGCKTLTSLDLSSFDTSNVTNMGGMFSGCSKLYSVKLSNTFSCRGKSIGDSNKWALLPTPSGSRYTGNWWKVVCGNEYSPAQLQKLSGDPVAGTWVWAEKTYLVTFDSNGGSAVDAVKVLPGHTVAKPANPTRSGYTFKEWQLNGNAYDFSKVVTEDITLKAMWTGGPDPDPSANKCTVSFNANGGSGSMSSVQVNKGSTYILPACGFTAPSGKEFYKWDQGKPGAQISVTADTKLTAQWKDKGTPDPDPDPEVGKVSMYRLYNPNSGEHFYTADANEHNVLVEAGWNDEGYGWVAPESSSTPVYRLYNSIGGEHHYTMDASERDMLAGVGWSDEGIGWYSDDSKGQVLYREYNPNAYANNHNYTTDYSEHDYLCSIGWNDEGTAWYGVAS